jgi:antitoxin component YwqK of YwqJK toxin-antitoxin module
MSGRSIFTLLLLLSTAALFAQPGDLNRTDAQGRKQGQWAKNWPNGKLRYEGQFKDDAPIGEFKHFDEEGILTTLQVYIDDGRRSRAQHFRGDGSLMAEGIYLGQAKDSVWRYFDEQGALRKIEPFQKGELHGEVITYYPDGKVAEKENWANGILHGSSKIWFANGNLRTELEYVNGKAEGKMITYRPNGRKEYEGNVKNGERNGSWFHFNSDGSIHMKMLYRNGLLKQEVRENGTFTELFPDERPRAEYTYKSGKKEGPFVEYHDNGKWVMKPVPAEQAATSADLQRELVGQTKKREGHYKNDLLEGEVKEYDERGKLVKVTKYAAGEAVGEEVKR